MKLQSINIYIDFDYINDMKPEKFRGFINTLKEKNLDPDNIFIYHTNDLNRKFLQKYNTAISELFKCEFNKANNLVGDEILFINRSSNLVLGSWSLNIVISNATSFEQFDCRYLFTRKDNNVYQNSLDNSFYLANTDNIDVTINNLIDTQVQTFRKKLEDVFELRRKYIKYPLLPNILEIKKEFEEYCKIDNFNVSNYSKLYFYEQMASLAIISLSIFKLDPKKALQTFRDCLSEVASEDSNPIWKKIIDFISLFLSKEVEVAFKANYLYNRDPNLSKRWEEKINNAVTDLSQNQGK